MSDDDRTTPLGLFNFACSYWQSGVHLHDANAKVTHPDAPVTLLLAAAFPSALAQRSGKKKRTRGALTGSFLRVTVPPTCLLRRGSTLDQRR